MYDRTLVFLRDNFCIYGRIFRWLIVNVARPYAGRDVWMKTAREGRALKKPTKALPTSECWIIWRILRARNM